MCVSSLWVKRTYACLSLRGKRRMCVSSLWVKRTYACLSLCGKGVCVSVPQVKRHLGELKTVTDATPQSMEERRKKERKKKRKDICTSVEFSGLAKKPAKLRPRVLTTPARGSLSGSLSPKTLLWRVFGFTVHGVPRLVLAQRPRPSETSTGLSLLCKKASGGLSVPSVKNVYVSLSLFL